MNYNYSAEAYAKDIHRPTKLENVIGNKIAVTEIYNWFLSDKTKDLIVLGPSGIGKSLTVDLCVEKSGVNAMYFPAAEITRKILDTQIKSIVNNFFVQNRVIIIDDIDESTTLSVPEIKKATQVPVIFIGKRVNFKVSLKKNQRVEFKKLYKKDTLPFIKAVAKAEKIKVPKKALDELVTGNNDIRSMLIALRNVNFSCKDITLDKFSMLKMICKTSVSYPEIEKLVGDESFYLQLLIQENYLNFNVNSQQIAEIADAISLNEISTPEHHRTLQQHGYVLETVVNNILPNCSKSRNSSFTNPYVNTLASRQRAKSSLLTVLRSKGLDRDRIDFLQIIINSKKKRNCSEYSDYGVEDLSIIKNLLIS